jgi:hypothetical protein
MPVLETVRNISFLSTILERYSEIALLVMRLTKSPHTYEPQWNRMTKCYVVLHYVLRNI